MPSQRSLKANRSKNKEIVTEVNAAVQAHSETSMCFYSSVVGHHPSVSFQLHGGEQAMIVDVDDKGQVVTGRWTGKTGKTWQSYDSDLTDNVKTFVLSALENEQQK